jgi:hypothetical protein
MKLLTEYACDWCGTTAPDLPAGWSKGPTADRGEWHACDGCEGDAVRFVAAHGTWQADGSVGVAPRPPLLEP